jgi:sugar lactone lactonase YvrE
MRWLWVTLISALVLTIGIATAPRSSRSDTPAFAESILGKAKCHYVKKKVHGKTKRVKVCTKPKPRPTPVPAPGHLIDASGYVWVDGAGNVYVSSGYLPSGANGWVSKLSPTGTRLATFRSKSTLDGASGVAVDDAGNVYVADLGSDRVVKFSSSGKEVASIGSPKSVPGELSAPSGIGLDGVGHLYVADSNNSRIQAFTVDGQYVGAIGPYGPDPGQLERPLDVAVDGHGNLLVADSENSRVEEFSSSGTFVTVWGTEGSGVGQFEHPKGICLDSVGNVYVADTGNRRIQKFASDGTPLFQWSTGEYEPVSPGVDSAGNVYATEDSPGGTAGYGVAKYAPDGHLLSLWR